MLASPVSFQRFQPITPNGAQVGEARSSLQPAQTFARLLFDSAKPSGSKALLDGLGFRGSERPNHIR